MIPTLYLIRVAMLGNIISIGWITSREVLLSSLGVVLVGDLC